ncbi:MAG: DUF4136 domain-containing protein [Longimicrobiales bacterium]|nr:DUF4136 domain-containing protein [Longimicrobiales bacterium]
MSISRRFLMTAAVALVAASCSVPMRGGGYFEPDANIDRYSSFAFDEHMDTPSRDSRLANNRFFEERLHEAIERELSWRGIHLDESDPGIVVHHHTSVADHVMVTEAVGEEGVPYEDVYEYEEGTVLVHLVDADTGENLWLGWAQADVAPAFQSPAAMTEWIDELLAQMFEGWPGPGAMSR